MVESIRFHNISKYFPGVQALEEVSLSIAKGEIHALIGENGAGKSTLVKILGGAHPATSGQLYLHGEEVHMQNAKDAINHGVRIIYQELQLIPQLTVAENLLLGNFDTNAGIINSKRMIQRVQDILDEYNIPIHADQMVEHLSIGEKQLVEIAKCCVGEPSIIALDEPTSSLSSKEIDILFALIRNLKDKGRTFLYISHRFNEIFNVCTSASVLRDGKLIHSYPTLKGVTSEDLIQYMVGRSLDTTVHYETRKLGSVRMEVKNLQSPFLDKPMDFYLRKHEILGFFGLVGAGRTELMRCLVGADPKLSGKVMLDGKQISIQSPKDSMNNGMAYLTEDRKKNGIIQDLDIVDNTMINSRVYFSPLRFFINKKQENRLTKHQVDALKTKISALTDKITQLSGGNQQKVIIGRWLSNTSINVLILDEPTRGIDVGAKQEIYKLIRELANYDYSIILVSSELPEIISLCDRTYVVHQKKNILEVSREKMNDTNLLNLAFFGDKEVS